jgi:formylglycine-generating enzyme required for sulfatase activity
MFITGFYDYYHFPDRTIPLSVSPNEPPDPLPPLLERTVILTKGFWIADSACTQALWQAVMGSNPAHFTGDPQRPVERVSWEDVQRFLAAADTGIPVGSIVLPTEAQREYASRAGKALPAVGPDLDAGSWNQATSDGQTHVVKQKSANPWGLFDMQGNVQEWCSDWDGPEQAATLSDPTGPTSGTYRIISGGSWDLAADDCCKDLHWGYQPGVQSNTVGFRFVVESGKPAKDTGTSNF